MKIVLIGYMGSGKSMIGKLLAKSLGIPFTDLDSAIEEQEGQTIPEIFETKGVIHFRKVESEVLQKVLSGSGPLILATGGGAPCYGDNIKTMKELASSVIYLQVPVPELARRLKNEKEYRPLIAGLAADELEEFIGKHLFERAPYYEEADMVMRCSGKTPEMVVQEIANTLV